MARYPLFLDDLEEGKFVSLGVKTSCMLIDGWLTFFRQERGTCRIKRQMQMQGQGPWEVLIRNGKISVVQMNPPEDKEKLIGWLCGAPGNCKATSDAEYRGKIEYYQAMMANGTDYDEHEYKGPAYKFMWSTLRDEYAKPYCVAYFVSQAITLPEIVALVREKGVYPEWYAFSILQERFGVTEEMWGNAQN